MSPVWKRVKEGTELLLLSLPEIWHQRIPVSFLFPSHLNMLNISIQIFHGKFDFCWMAFYYSSLKQLCFDLSFCKYLNPITVGGNMKLMFLLFDWPISFSDWSLRRIWKYLICCLQFLGRDYVSGCISSAVWEAHGQNPGIGRRPLQIFANICNQCKTEINLNLGKTVSICQITSVIQVAWQDQHCLSN